jgi:signal-transduction protein with cAMP-binding, CBS, and nucleotidyltransferase domain
MNVEQVTLEPASAVNAAEPFQKILDLTAATGNSTFVVLDGKGNYAGMIVGEDIQTALLAREAIPLLIVGELARRDLPIVKHSDDLQSVMDSFSQYDVSHLPVTMAQQSKHVIGLISRAGLMRSYQAQLAIQ